MSVGEDLAHRLRQGAAESNDWIVFADWLTNEGDPRGEAILIAHRLKTEDLADEERAALAHRYAVLTDPSRYLERDGRDRPVPVASPALVGRGAVACG